MERFAHAFATIYTAEGKNERRVRYHTELTEDDGLIERRLRPTRTPAWQSGFVAEFENLDDEPPRVLT